MKSPTPLSKKIWILLGVLAILVVAGVVLLAYSSKTNHAQESAALLERALISAGFDKVCSRTDPGHGPDNYEPWYIAYFKSALPSGRARDTAIKAAKDNGFNIQQTPQGTKGYLGDVVYMDAQTKNSSYADLQNGKVSLAVAFTNSGTVHACSPTAITTDASHTAISIEVRLPRSR